MKDVASPLVEAFGERLDSWEVAPDVTPDDIPYIVDEIFRLLVERRIVSSAPPGSALETK